MCIFFLTQRMRFSLHIFCVKPVFSIRIFSHDFDWAQNQCKQNLNEYLPIWLNEMRTQRERGSTTYVLCVMRKSGVLHCIALHCVRCTRSMPENQCNFLNECKKKRNKTLVFISLSFHRPWLWVKMMTVNGSVIHMQISWNDWR